MPTYSYVFSHLSRARCDYGFDNKVLPWWEPMSAFAGSGWASHGTDVSYVFNTTYGPDGCAADENVRIDCPYVGEVCTAVI